MRPNSLADELLVDLRRQFGEKSPVAWSASITCDSPLSVPAEWYDQETCLGDFLRVVPVLHDTRLAQVPTHQLEDRRGVARVGGRRLLPFGEPVLEHQSPARGVHQRETQVGGDQQPQVLRGLIGAAANAFQRATQLGDRLLVEMHDEVVEVFEDDRPTNVLEQPLVGGSAFENGAIRRDVPEQGE